jgi:uroporphyrinogen-III synthase
LFRIAAEEQVGDAMQGTLRRMVIASIGPTTSETLEEYGLTPDITPSHPKMGFLVKETAEQAAAILERKRAIHA